uniref:Zinc finger protein 91 n=2 Tax=Cacopsylla melanoneura TaxID=428564 RepID=A0A8D8QJ56_9HEMI
MIPDYKQKLKRRQLKKLRRRLKKLRRKKYKEHILNTVQERNRAFICCTSASAQKVMHNRSIIIFNEINGTSIPESAKVIKASCENTHSKTMNQTIKHIEYVQRVVRNITTCLMIINKNMNSINQQSSRTSSGIFENDSQSIDNIRTRERNLVEMKFIEGPTNTSKHVFKENVKAIHRTFESEKCSSPFEINTNMALQNTTKVACHPANCSFQDQTKFSCFQNVTTIGKSSKNGKEKDLEDLDTCIHCNQFVGGEAMSNITQHSVLCKNRNIKCLTCFKCNYTTRNLRQYENHCFHVHYSSKLACPKCQHVSNNIFTFVVHRRKHLNLRPYQCDVCMKYFITLHTMHRHKEIHNVNQSQKQLQCRMCTKTFSLKHYRREHEMTHNKKLQLKCKYCFYKTNRRMYLNKHIHMHEMGRIFFNKDRFCETCKIAFQNKQVFVIHVLEKHMENYTVFVKKKKMTQDIEDKEKDNMRQWKRKISNILVGTQTSQLTRKKVKIKRYKDHGNQTDLAPRKFKIIRIKRRNRTNTCAPQDKS